MTEKVDLHFLEELIKNEIQESNSLEFKSADSLYKLITKLDKEYDEFSKDISAIANSNGGMIIYGIKECRKGPKKGCAEKFSPIDKEKFSPDRVEQIMNSRIQPRIQKYTMHIIDISEAEYVLAIDIAQSTTIHMANNGCYYKRFEFQAVKMDDWEVKSLVNRSNVPLLKEKIFIRKILIAGFAKTSLYKKGKFRYEMLLAVENEGMIMAKYVHCFMRIDISAKNSMSLRGLKPAINEDYIELAFDNKESRKIKVGENIITIGEDYQPVLPFSWRQIGIIKVSQEFLENKHQITFYITTEKSSKEVILFSNEVQYVES